MRSRVHHVWLVYQQSSFARDAYELTANLLLWHSAEARGTAYTGETPALTLVTPYKKINKLCATQT